MKTYCYVTAECCRILRTAKPGEEVDGRPGVEARRFHAVVVWQTGDAEDGTGERLYVVGRAGGVPGDGVGGSPAGGVKPVEEMR